MAFQLAKAGHAQHSCVAEARLPTTDQPGQSFNQLATQLTMDGPDFSFRRDGTIHCKADLTEHS